VHLIARIDIRLAVEQRLHCHAVALLGSHVQWCLLELYTHTPQ